MGGVHTGTRFTRDSSAAGCGNTERTDPTDPATRRRNPSYGNTCIKIQEALCFCTGKTRREFTSGNTEAVIQTPVHSENEILYTDLKWKEAALGEPARARPRRSK